jgi:putative hemolysin
MPGSEIGILVIVVVFLLLSAFFSSSEAALLSMLRTARLAHLVSTGSASAARVARMLEEPGRLLSTILLGNNLANVAFATLVTVITLSFIDDQGIAILVATAIGTAVLLVLGEIIPKNFAVQHALPVAFLVARPLSWIELLFWPLVVILQWFSRVATIGDRGPGVLPSITEAELRTLIEIGDAEGAIEPEEAEMLESVFRFGDREVRDMMTPRTEIVFLERGTTMGEFLSIYAEHAHTRFPVYKGSTDNVVGILSAKDILIALSARDVGPLDAVTEVIRDAHFVPETKRIAELFDELRRSGNQMAIAIDEYGGIAGLVTLKALLEEVVGRVGEEGASPEEEYETLGENTFQVDGGMSIDEVKEDLDIDLGDGDFETAAGFVLEALGHIPTEGEVFESARLIVEIMEMDGLKIETIKLTKKPGDG